MNEQNNLGGSIGMVSISTTDKEAAIEAWINYVKKNPVKAKYKKEAYFKKYGLDINIEDEVETAEVKELKEIKNKIIKNK